MMKTTQKELRRILSIDASAVDITHADNAIRDFIIKKESHLTQIAYSTGVYGYNGMLFKGHKTGTLYIIASRTTAIYIFG